MAPLVEETARDRECPRKSLFIAAFSAASPSGVEVAWAFTYVTSDGDALASRRAEDMHLSQEQQQTETWNLEPTKLGI